MGSIDFSRLRFDGNKRSSGTCVPKAGEGTAQLVEASKSVYIVSRMSSIRHLFYKSIRVEEYTATPVTSC